MTVARRFPVPKYCGRDKISNLRFESYKHCDVSTDENRVSDIVLGASINEGLLNLPQHDLQIWIFTQPKEIFQYGSDLSSLSI